MHLSKRRLNVTVTCLNIIMRDPKVSNISLPQTYESTNSTVSHSNVSLLLMNDFVRSRLFDGVSHRRITRLFIINGFIYILCKCH